MRKFKVTIDTDEVIEDVIDYTTPGGNLLMIYFTDGSARGVTGFCDFRVEIVKP